MTKIARRKTDPELGRDVLYTYRYLRAGMIALLLMLLFAVAYEGIADGGCFLGSISAYYFTPARTVFVGALFALGALLIVHNARSAEEDVLLDFSGFMAFVVAMVPTVPDGACGPTPTLTTLEVANAVRNNIWALIVVAVLAAIVRYVLARRGELVISATPGSRIASIVCGVVLVVELGFFLWKRDSFIHLSHGIAAATMVAGVIAVMVLNALYQPSTERGVKFRRSYYALAVLLGVALAGTVALHLAIEGFAHIILVAEVVIIVLFGAFWVVQTVEVWPTELDEMRDQVQSVEVPGR